MQVEVRSIRVRGGRRLVGVVSEGGRVVAMSLPCLDRNFAHLQGTDVAREVVRTTRFNGIAVAPSIE